MRQLRTAGRVRMRPSRFWLAKLFLRSPTPAMQSAHKRLSKLILRVAISCATLLLVATNLSASSQQSGPTTLITTYRCAPANRAAFRESIVQTDVPGFESWKRAGILENYRFFFNWYVDENTWDLMAMLSFRQYADVGRWREIERTSPGGLSRESLRLGGPTMTYSVDLTWHGAAPHDQSDTGKSVFL